MNVVGSFACIIPISRLENIRERNSYIYRRAVRSTANFLTRTKKSQFRAKKAIVWAHFWLFSGDIGFSSSGSSKLAFLRTLRKENLNIKNLLF